MDRHPRRLLSLGFNDSNVILARLFQDINLKIVFVLSLLGCMSNL